MKEFLQLALTLKHLDRAGWKRVGISTPESVASHSWGLALLCLELAPENLDLQKLLSLAIIHDLPEIIVGDITPHDNITKAEKSEREKQAARELLPTKLYDLWWEYEENITEEAQFVHAMDKLDMALQAEQYAEIADTMEFIQSAYHRIPEEYQQWFSSKFKSQ